MRHTLITGIALAALPFLVPQTTSAQEKPKMTDARTISVSGTAERLFTPDKAKFYLSLQDVKGDKSMSIEKSEQALLKALEQAGIPKTDMTGSGSQASTWYGRRGKQQTEQTRQYVIVIHRPNQAATLLNALNERAVANAYTGDYELTTHDAEEDKLRTEALLKAKDRARTMAATLGEKLGKPLAITDGTADVRPEYPGRMMKFAEMAAGDMQAAPQPINLEFQQMQLSSNCERHLQPRLKPLAQPHNKKGDLAIRSPFFDSESLSGLHKLRFILLHI